MVEKEKKIVNEMNSNIGINLKPNLMNWKCFNLIPTKVNWLLGLDTSFCLILTSSFLINGRSVGYLYITYISCIKDSIIA